MFRREHQSSQLSGLVLAFSGIVCFGKESNRLVLGRSCSHLIRQPGAMRSAFRRRHGLALTPQTFVTPEHKPELRNSVGTQFQSKRRDDGSHDGVVV